MLHSSEEAGMRHHTRTGSLPLILLLIGVIALPLIPEASAEAGRDDWAARIAEMDRALAQGQTQAATATWREAYVAAHVTRRCARAGPPGRPRSSRPAPGAPI
jgi:hypothetical protein